MNKKDIWDCDWKIFVVIFFNIVLKSDSIKLYSFKKSNKHIKIVNMVKQYSELLLLNISRMEFLFNLRWYWGNEAILFYSLQLYSFKVDLCEIIN